MSEKWLLSRCEGYAVRIDESTANCSTERMTRLKRRRNEAQGTPPAKQVGGIRRTGI